MRTLSEPGIMKETSLASQPTPVASPQASPRPNPQPNPRRSRLPGRFARLPELAGAGFLPIGLFARLPLAMLTVGTLTLVTAVSHSYAIGGMAAFIPSRRDPAVNSAGDTATVLTPAGAMA